MIHYGGVFDLSGKKERLQEIENLLSKPDSWDDPEKMTPVLREKSGLESIVNELEKLKENKIQLQEWLELIEEDPSQEFLKATEDQYFEFKKHLKKTELQTLLSLPEDKNEAILEIHSGAGGTDAQDWAEMLFRMYTRWSEENNYTTKLLDYLPGDEAGIKSVTLSIEGKYAYGLLKGEKGIHRLIRISPFDTSGRRHTSFASVDVYPDVSQDIKIDLKDEDLRIDVFRSSGPGGQSVNTTSSAVRVTHIPTGLVVQCQNEKSQLRNKDTALKILKARLYEIELQKQEEDKQIKYNEKSAISWGSQIRTYTIQPYRLVKDHRTNYEETNVEKVLDGNLNEFLRSYLLNMPSQNSQSKEEVSQFS